MVVTAWFGFVAPAGTPADVVNKIQVVETDRRDKPKANVIIESASMID
jgi:tripartite-type tricarboxylate transporter receptor subunit TctC